jgi:phosphoglycerate kinase
MAKLSLRDVDVKERRVLTRVDFNVPIKEGRVTDDTRIRASLDTIRYLIENGARVILCSHLGRPKKPDPSLSLLPVAKRLAEILGRPVRFVRDCVGPEAEVAVRDLAPGGVLLLENLRFHPEEEKNDPDFAGRLALLADVFVNDAFGSAHRAHASTEGVTRHIKPCVAGFLMESELVHLGGALESPRRPFVAILGGVKVSGKIDVIQNLLPKVDALFIGGAMAFTFARARKIETGRSLVEDDRIPVAEKVLQESERLKVDLRLPIDLRVSSSTDGSDPGEVVRMASIPPDKIGVDIGPETIQGWAPVLLQAGTILWNGPMGIFEVSPFKQGTMEIARIMAEATASGAVTIVGGGDSAAAIAEAGVAGHVTHVSTGGGASLEFLEGKVLPGVAALTERVA